MEAALYRNISASTLIETGYGRVMGIIINSHTSGTIKLWDSLTATGTVMVETLALNVGEHFIPLFNMSYNTGLFVTIGGTANITVVYA